MTAVQRRWWNKPIRTETNSAGPGSPARPFTTSHRTNECGAAIFPPPRPLPSSLPSSGSLPSFLKQQVILKHLIPSPPRAASFPRSVPPPRLLCAGVIVDAKGRGPRGSYRPPTSVGVSGDEMERSRPAGGLDGSFNAERGVCKQTAADRVYACHNRSGP